MSSLMKKPLVLSLCTGLGLMDLAFLDTGFRVLPACEIDRDMCKMYEQLCNAQYPMYGNIKSFVDDLEWTKNCIDRHFAPLYPFLDNLVRNGVDGIIGGPPCQALSRLKGIREPKYPDLTPYVEKVLQLEMRSLFLHFR